MNDETPRRSTCARASRAGRDVGTTRDDAAARAGRRGGAWARERDVMETMLESKRRITSTSDDADAVMHGATCYGAL